MNFSVNDFVQILEKWYLKEYPNQWNDTYDLWSWGNFEHFLSSPVQIGELRFEIVENQDTGNREDFTEAEPVYVVVSVTDVTFSETVFFRRDGYVQSFGESELGEWELVKPVQKTITVYE